jgi:glycosidase
LSADVYARREADWRNGPVVYQVWVDRFAPPADPTAKAALYSAPKTLRRWDELPAHGSYLPDVKVWSHEIDFWGGDFASLRTRLDHVQQLGVDVLYLNPIHLATTNHKYDALDYQAVSPEYGTRDDVKDLAQDLHGRGMKLVLDGVFNHMGRNSPKFQSAQADEHSPYRDWFFIGPQYAATGDARVWWGAVNLPELNLENSTVRDHVFAGRDSVIRAWLRDGVDGWRLDTAYEFGRPLLTDMTRAAHAEKPGSLMVGEIVNYPAGWIGADGPLDGVMNFTLRVIMLKLAQREITPATAQRMIERMVLDVGIEPLLKSWTMLDNHDLPRLASRVPDVRQRRFAQVLQFTLPGAPNLWQGGELDMVGDGDPEQRAPMRWDLVEQGHPALTFTRELISLRKTHRALRLGDLRTVVAQDLLAFERHTDRSLESVFVFANPADHDVTETVLITNPLLMNATGMRDLLPVPGLDANGPRPQLDAAVLRVTVPAGAVRVMQPVFEPLSGYTPYKRVP